MGDATMLHFIHDLRGSWISWTNAKNFIKLHIFVYLNINAHNDFCFSKSPNSCLYKCLIFRISTIILIHKMGSCDKESRFCSPNCSITFNKVLQNYIFSRKKILPVKTHSRSVPSWQRVGEKGEMLAIRVAKIGVDWWILLKASFRDGIVGARLPGFYF